ncbi:11711_t:CDS:2 [Paraglomus brasilianum]|uniref:11711_t:CDS:1 n=1 Tax=Paraglomus brasilianum TaxID=144538 RepID=A0A9N8ZN13_9GLOM|nr:11711_t:CDS:2 [Paraglomus brasilianum]
MQPFNKYYPPDWDPSQASTGSVNKFVGKHPLGDRARKIDQGILIVSCGAWRYDVNVSYSRFELPFNIWCEGCENHIGKGVRYNAEKKKAGNYYSTPIWSFRMKCHLCDNWFEIQTDPKNAEYVVVSGARRKEEEWDPEDTGTIKLKDDDEARKLAEDAFYKLEHAVKDEQKHAAAVPALTQLQRLNERQWADPYTLSQKMRKIFRASIGSIGLGLRCSVVLTGIVEFIRMIRKCGKYRIGKMRKYLIEMDPVLEQAQKRKLEVTASSIFEPRSSRKESKKTKVSALAAKDKIAQLSAMAKVNTKLKIDPFLRSDTVVSKPNNVGSVLGIVKRKNAINHAEASGSSEWENMEEEVDEPIDEVMKNILHSQRERAADVRIPSISLVSTDYDNDDSEESEETEEG